MPRILIAFASARTASISVAGIPAVARAVREAWHAVELTGKSVEILLVLPEGRLSDSLSKAEIARLAPGLRYSVTSAGRLTPLDGDIFIAGELLMSADRIEACLSPDPEVVPIEGVGSNARIVESFHGREGEAKLLQKLNRSSKQILHDTIKQTDGIVSRYINRPISIRISGILLRVEWIRPDHATGFALLVALVMFACLVSGSYTGLIAGACLFQAASVIDGVDGEIARATLRTSARGATLDSLTDALTNLGFLIGLGISLAQQGDDKALALGLSGFICFGVGLAVLGSHAVATGRSLNFDGAKHILRRHQSAFTDWLVWLTMRDFLALAAAVMIILGMGKVFIFLFAFGSFFWLIAAVALIIHDSRRKVP